MPEYNLDQYALEANIHAGGGLGVLNQFLALNVYS